MDIFNGLIIEISCYKLSIYSNDKLCYIYFNSNVIFIL